MSRPDRAALKAITDELRTLPGRGDTPGEQLESAGRLLIVAIEAGAFAEPQFVGFRAMVCQRREQPTVNGFISAWSEAVWWLKGKPKETPNYVRDLASDVELVIDRILARPKSEEPCWSSAADGSQTKQANL